jgi:hypothetical protein
MADSDGSVDASTFIDGFDGSLTSAVEGDGPLTLRLGELASAFVGGAVLNVVYGLGGFIRRAALALGDTARLLFDGAGAFYREAVGLTGWLTGGAAQTATFVQDAGLPGLILAVVAALVVGLVVYVTVRVAVAEVVR